MKISLVAPQTPFLEAISFPPLNLLYLNSFLKMNGYKDTQIVDLNITGDVPQADVYIITATTPQFPYALDILKNIDGTAIIGGAHVTADPESCVSFDKIVVGDGEYALLQCLSDIKAGISRHEYTGVPVSNLDSLPMPDRNDIDPDNYKYYIDDKPSTIAMTSRGCPYNCYFCTKRHGKVRFHSTEYVLKELRHIRDCGYGGVYFEDDIFTLRKDLPELAEETRRFAWRCQIRPDENIQNIGLLSRMGCSHVSIGLESGSQKILDIVNKKADVKRVRDLIRECRVHDIKIRLYMIVGLPSETHETVRETVEFLRDVEPDSVGVGTFVPYPGTHIHSHMDKFDIRLEEKDYRKWYFRAGSSKYECVVSTSGLTAKEILDYRDKIDKEFNK